MKRWLLPPYRSAFCSYSGGRFGQSLMVTVKQTDDFSGELEITE